MNSCESYDWLTKSHEEKIVSGLENLYLSLGKFHNLSETVIQHALSSSDSKVNCFIIKSILNT